MKMTNTAEDLKKLREVDKALDGMEGILIPYNIIKNSIIPFREWLKQVLNNE